jgi:hypothetical protein
VHDREVTPARSDSSGLPSHYRARLIEGAEVCEQGLAHGRGDERSLLAWSEVLRAFAAEVGEPEGIRTVVFDLVIGIEGLACRALRFDAEPGEAACAVASAIEQGVGADRCDASLHTVAEEGFVTPTHPDLEPFDEACLESLRRKPLGLRASPAADGPDRSY